MPIQVLTKKMQSGRRDAAGDFETELINETIDGVAADLRKELQAAECEKHPGQTSTLTVLGDPRTMVRIEKTSFCCQEFSDSVKVSVQ